MNTSEHSGFAQSQSAEQPRAADGQSRPGLLSRLLGRLKKPFATRDGAEFQMVTQLRPDIAARAGKEQAQPASSRGETHDRTTVAHQPAGVAHAPATHDPWVAIRNLERATELKDEFAKLKTGFDAWDNREAGAPSVRDLKEMAHQLRNNAGDFATTLRSQVAARDVVASRHPQQRQQRPLTPAPARGGKAPGQEL